MFNSEDYPYSNFGFIYLSSFGMHFSYDIMYLQYSNFVNGPFGSV
jgi:hypothetical protein